MIDDAQRYAIPRREVAAVGEEQILVGQVERVQRDGGDAAQRVFGVPRKRRCLVQRRSGHQRVLVGDGRSARRQPCRVLEVLDAEALLQEPEVGGHERRHLPW
jgi:hypothetical protein